MDVARLVLDFIEVVLSGPVMGAVVTVVVLVMFRKDLQSLLARTGRIRFPGGEFEATQLQKSQETRSDGDSPVPEDPSSLEPEELPSHLTPEQIEVVRQLLRSERARAALWEYRYLNYYLVRGTQVVLNWFSTLQEPVSYELFHTFWSSVIPSVREREAIIRALQNHYLIKEAGGLFAITPKGHEYLNWRGPLPPMSPPTLSVPEPTATREGDEGSDGWSGRTSDN